MPGAYFKGAGYSDMDTKPNKIKLKIKNSVVILGSGPDNQEGLMELIRNFDAANATPLDCMDFIRRVKKLLR